MIFFLVAIIVFQLFGPWLTLFLLSPSASADFPPWGVWVMMGALLLEPLAISIYTGYNRHLLPRGSLRFLSAFYLAASVTAMIPAFVIGYYSEAHRSSECLSEEAISRPDAIYFTMTTFTTTGYGDIHPVSTTCRMLASTQMGVDIFLFAFVIAWAIGKTTSLPPDEENQTYRGVGQQTFEIKRPWWLPGAAVRTVINRIDRVGSSAEIPTAAEGARLDNSQPHERPDSPP